MSKNLTISVLRIAFCVICITAFVIAAAHHAIASIDIRDLGNSDSVSIEMRQKKSQSKSRPSANHVNTRPANQPGRQRASSSIGNQSRSGGDARIPVDGLVTIPGCYLGTMSCQRNILADRSPETNIPQAAAPPVQVPPESVPVEIVITTSDLMELIPSTPQILMDRGPFGLKNAHTNFYASDHQAQTVTETMFGQQVTIVATPVEYRWDYGDGSTLMTTTPGRPVDAFNVETETSHQYTEPGRYTVTLTTVFEGTYQVDGGPTQAVSSTVTQQADPVEIQIWRAVTRNVDQTCAENPSAWGC